MFDFKEMCFDVVLRVNNFVFFFYMKRDDYDSRCVGFNRVVGTEFVGVKCRG